MILKEKVYFCRSEEVIILQWPMGSIFSANETAIYGAVEQVLH